MTWRTIVLTKDCKIHLRLNHLVVSGEDVVTIPLSEIGQVIIENPNIVMTGHILNGLSKHKIMTIICNEKHMPYSHINLVYAHFRQPQVIEQQINWRKDYKQILWKFIIKEKIKNQQDALSYYFNETSNLLEEYKSQVEIADKTNREGHAAKVYFHELFGKSFVRGSDNPINWGLNYGYSLLLSLFTKTIITKGLLTELGIHHRNQYNHYNLASDFMEIYRPLVDVIVKKNIFDEFGKQEKRKLLNLFNKKVEIKNKKQYLANSIDIYVDSLINYLEKGDEKALAFPTTLFL